MSNPDIQRLEHTLSYRQLPLKNRLALIREIVLNSIPSIGAYATGTLISMISVYYLSKYGDDDLVAGYGLGVVFTSAVVMSLIFSLNQAGNILMSESFGAKDYRACGLYFQKSLLLLALMLSPLFLALLFADKIMTAFYIQKNLAEIGVIYTRLAIPALMGNAMFDTMKAFITSQKIFQPIIYIQLTNLVLHFFWAKLFIEILQLGVEGAILCKIVEEWTNVLIIYAYIKRSGNFTETWIPWSKEAFNLRGLWKQLKFSLPIAVTTYIDWVYYEIMTLISGTFEAKNVVAHIAVANTSTMNFMIGMGIAVTMTTYISNAVGKQALNEAKNYFYTGIIILMTYAGLAVIIFIPCRELWAQFWSLDPETQTYLVEVVMIFCVSGLWIDSINNGQLGLLRAMGKQKIAAIMMVSSIYLIGVPLMIIFTFLLDYQVKGLWAAFGIANAVLAIWGFMRVIKVDWVKDMEDLRERRERLETEKNSQGSTELPESDKETEKVEEN